MARKLRPALVRGIRAQFWLHSNDCLLWRSPDKLAEVRVPVGDLLDEDRMRLHFDRVAALAPAVVLDELDEIVAGARA